MSEINPRAYADRSVDVIIGENVHRLMWRNGDTQLSMAPLLGMTQGALSNKLKGKRPWFAAEIDAVVARYNVTHGDLFDASFTPERPHSSV